MTGCAAAATSALYEVQEVPLTRHVQSSRITCGTRPYGICRSKASWWGLERGGRPQAFVPEDVC
jgi:hypothetical protein